MAPGQIPPHHDGARAGRCRRQRPGKHGRARSQIGWGPAGLASPALPAPDRSPRRPRGQEPRRFTLPPPSQNWDVVCVSGRRRKASPPCPAATDASPPCPGAALELYDAVGGIFAALPARGGGDPSGPPSPPPSCLLLSVVHCSMFPSLALRYYTFLCNETPRHFPLLPPHPGRILPSCLRHHRT